MNCLCISLFGKFCVTDQNENELPFDLVKVQELFFYLLLHATRPHTREKLAELLWQDSSTDQSRKYLRQTLWKLQAILEKVPMDQNMLIVESDWIQINPQAIYLLDTQVFESAYLQTQGLVGSEIYPKIAQLLAEAVALYKGDLLENWYHEWCLFERERLQNIYLTMLFKLMVYYEYSQQFEVGITCGMKMLQCDPAREHTYRQLMRLHFLAGDRIGALRQYDRCKIVLKQELNVKPAKQTFDLAQQIRKGSLPDRFPEKKPVFNSQINDSGNLNLLNNLSDLKETLVVAQQQIDHHLDILQNRDAFHP